MSNIYVGGLNRYMLRKQKQHPFGDPLEEAAEGEDDFDREGKDENHKDSGSDFKDTAHVMTSVCRCLSSGVGRLGTRYTPHILAADPDAASHQTVKSQLCGQHWSSAR